MVDTDQVDTLIDSISEAIVDATEEGNSNSISEIVSALFTVLDRMLNGVRNQPPSAEKTANILLINQTLMSLMIPIGKPH